MKANPNADQLTQEGRVLYQHGRYEQALAVWEKATREYQERGDTEGKVGSLVNQSLAFQVLGQYRRSCQVLIEALEGEERVCASPSGLGGDEEKIPVVFNGDQMDTPVEIVALKNLGDTLRLQGKLEESEAVLKQAIEQNRGYRENLLLSLGTTVHSLYSRDRSRYLLTDIPVERAKLLQMGQKRAQTALELYIQVLKEGSRELSLHAQLNRLHLLIELTDWTRIQVEQESIATAILNHSWIII